MNVSLVAAMTQDGFIGRVADDRSFDWTSEEDSRFYVKTIREADAIVMGSQTFKGIKLHPRNSHYLIYSRKPENFENPRPKVITVEATNLEPEKLIEKLKEEGRDNVVVAGGSSIYKMFVEAGVLDVLYLVKEPAKFGEGILLFKDLSFEEVVEGKVGSNNPGFELVSEKKLNNKGTVLQEWRKKNL